jgi:hypothetical protein
MTEWPSACICARALPLQEQHQASLRAPPAVVKVADRFQLLMNVREALEKVMYSRTDC